VRYLKTIISRLESYITTDEPEQFVHSDTHDRLTKEERDFADWLRMVRDRLDQMEREDNA